MMRPITKATLIFHIANAAVVIKVKVSAWDADCLLAPPSANCAPVKNRMTPSTGDGNILKSTSIELLKKTATIRMISEAPVRAPKATCLAMPPAP